MRRVDSLTKVAELSELHLPSPSHFFDVCCVPVDHHRRRSHSSPPHLRAPPSPSSNRRRSPTEGVLAAATRLLCLHSSRRISSPLKHKPSLPFSRRNRRANMRVAVLDRDTQTATELGARSPLQPAGQLGGPALGNTARWGRSISYLDSAAAKLAIPPRTVRDRNTTKLRPSARKLPLTRPSWSRSGQ